MDFEAAGTRSTLARRKFDGAHQAVVAYVNYLVVVGEGIDGLLGLTCALVLDRGDTVVTSDGAYPTFNYHVTGYGGRLVFVPYRADWHNDVDGLLAIRAEITEKRRARGQTANADLNDKNIRMPGYLLPLEFENRKVTEFLLVPWVGACIHTPPPPPNQIVHVKLENGFDLTDYDQRSLDFAKDYSEKLLAIDVNIDVDEMLITGWSLFNKHFKPEEVGIKQDLVDKYWKEN